MARFDELTDNQWRLIEGFFQELAKREKGKSYTPWSAVANTILWVLLSTRDGVIRRNAMGVSLSIS